MSRWYSAFKWFKEQFCDVEGLAADALEISVYDFLTSMATKSNEGANGLFFLPYFAGAVTPNQDPNARGAYLGMTVGHTKADFIRATMEEESVLIFATCWMQWWPVVRRRLKKYV